MSELKAVHAYQLTTNTEDSDVYIHNDEFGCGGDLVECYIKADADKVIAELKDKIQQKDFFWEGCGFSKMGFKNTIDVANYVEELKKEKEYVIEQTAEVINGQEKELLRHKYKRCLAMAQVLVMYDPMTNRKAKWRDKWRKRWLVISEKFKEAK